MGLGTGSWLLGVLWPVAFSTSVPHGCSGFWLCAFQGEEWGVQNLTQKTSRELLDLH